MLHILRLAIPNVYLLTGERAVLIDSGGPGDVARVLAFLKAHQADDKLALILLTHGHWDHAGGAADLRRLTGAPIALHRADAELVRSGAVPKLAVRTPMEWIVHRFFDRPFPPFEPDILFDDERDLHEFGVDGRIVFTPGHTAGSVSVLTVAKEAVVGDLVFGGFLGGWLFPRHPGRHYFTEDAVQLQASIAKLLAVTPIVIHPGHGGPLDPHGTARRFGITS